MNITVNYLTWLRNKLGQSKDEIDIGVDINTVSELLDFLEKKGPQYKNTFGNRNVIYADIAGNIVDHDTSIKGQNEINLFGPIVGG